MSYTFATIDPRPAAREQVLADLAAVPSFGLEVTIPELAEACSLGNIDPQHLGGDPNTAAIEVALDCPLPSEGARLVTLRADADSIGAMAVLECERRAANGELPVYANRQDLHVRHSAGIIAAADKHHSEWSPGDRFWEATPLDALKAMVMDHRRSVQERVELTLEWLVTGSFAGLIEVAAQVETDRKEAVGLLDEVQTSPTGRVAVIATSSRFGVSAAYAVAPVVIAVNENFSFNGGPTHRKVTVCQSRPGLVDLRSVFVALNEIEPAWGGSPTIGGSPQGVSSVIPTDEIVRIVEEHLL